MTRPDGSLVEAHGPAPWIHPAMRHEMMSFGAALLLVACASAGRQPDARSAEQEVLETERAFARSMAERDFEAFVSFLSEEAVFFSGETPIRGWRDVAARWEPYFSGDTAPFSWEPGHVEVLASGGLALSTGPVFDPTGKQIATFTSIWREESPGQWRIVFDRGNPVCDPTQDE